MKYTNFSELKGKIIKKIVVDEVDKIDFYIDDGTIYRMFHRQDCCETVEIDEIIGDLDDLLNEPILIADETSNMNEDCDYKKWQIIIDGFNNTCSIPKNKKDESFTWTFYRIGTIKGDVVIRWYGTSNGYYSEKVYFAKLLPQEVE